MKKFLGFLLLVFLSFQIFAKDKGDTLQISEDDIIHHSKKFIAVVSKSADTEGVYTVNIRSKKNNNIVTGKRINEFKIKTFNPRAISLSDDGTMLLPYEVPEKHLDNIAQCIDRDGNLLWERHYQDKDPADSIVRTSILLSPNGKYVVMSTNDTFKLISGKNGKWLPSKLDTIVKDPYTAFFDKNSNVVVVQTDWSMLKYDPEKDVIIKETKIPDPAEGKYRIVLNSQELRSTFNQEKGLFAIELREINPQGYPNESFSTRNWLVIIDTDLNVRMLKDVHAAFIDMFFMVNDGVLVPVVYKMNGKDIIELRFYCLSHSEPIVIDNQPKYNHVTFAAQKGDELLYHARGFKNKFIKYNLKKRQLDKNGIESAFLSDDDTLSAFQISKWRD